MLTNVKVKRARIRAKTSIYNRRVNEQTSCHTIRATFAICKNGRSRKTSERRVVNKNVITTKEENIRALTACNGYITNGDILRSGAYYYLVSSCGSIRVSSNVEVLNCDITSVGSQIDTYASKRATIRAINVRVWPSSHQLDITRHRDGIEDTDRTWN